MTETGQIFTGQIFTGQLFTGQQFTGLVRNQLVSYFGKKNFDQKILELLVFFLILTYRGGTERRN